MSRLVVNTFLAVIFSSGLSNGQDFEVPDALVEVFTPRGLRVSIPDQEGIKLFAFHGKINEEMNGREGGTFSRDITKAKDGRWTFYDSQAKLNVGDVLYYWTYVDYFDGQRKLGYPKDDQSFAVKELLPKPGSKPVPSTSTARIPTVVTRAPTDDICQAYSVTTVKGKNSCRGQLIFDSQFRHFSENKETLWNVERKFAAGPDYEFVLYEDSPRTLAVNDSYLTITPILTDSVYGDGFCQSDSLDLGSTCTGAKGSAECHQKAEGWSIIAPVMSSQITTKGKFSFKYGKVEVRAKLPAGSWLYPELFLNPESEEYGPHKEYGSGQIRIAITRGNEGDSKRLEGGVMLGHKPAARKYGMCGVEKTQSWTDDFHNFTVLWTPDSITVSADGTIYCTILPADEVFYTLASKWPQKYADRWRTGGKLAPFDKEMYILVGVGAGGHNFEDRDDGTKPWFNNKPISQKNFYKDRNNWHRTWHASSARLFIDYIKVWALDV